MKRDLIKYTLDGEVYVAEDENGERTEHPLRTVELVEPFHHTVTISHTQYMSDLLDAINYVKEVQPDRMLPLTIEEGPYFFDSSEFQKDLIGSHLIKIQPLTFTVPDGEMVTTEVIYFTPQGRAFVRKYIDHLYAVTSET